MPRLVSEVRIGGNRVDLATDLLELRVVVLQVLELRRADEGEVGRVEEQNVPLAEQVFLGDGLELAVDERLGGELADFLVDKRHDMHPFLRNVNSGWSNGIVLSQAARP